MAYFRLLKSAAFFSLFLSFFFFVLLMSFQKKEQKRLKVTLLLFLDVLLDTEKKK